MDYTAKKSLEIFSELCGERKFANVRIVTTDWDGVDEYEGETREKALSERYFKHLIDGGAKMFRHDGALQSAQSIVSGLIEQSPVTLKMQEELGTGRALGNTSAGAVIMREMKEMQKEHEVRMQTLKDEMDRESKDMRDQLEAERRELVKRMAQIQEDSNRLEETRLAPHTPDLGNTSSENVNATIPGRDRHPQGRDTPNLRLGGEQLRAFVPALGLILAKRHLNTRGVLLGLLGILVLWNKGGLYRMYRSWLYGGGITWPPVLDWFSGGVWPDLMLSTGVNRDEQAALGPVDDSPTEGQSEPPCGSSDTTPMIVSPPIGHTVDREIPSTAFSVEEKDEDDDMKENQMPGSWCPQYHDPPPVSHSPRSDALPDSRL